jgi:murein DD-endopeptidase MepM/ murein hydrolase activator NlpD
MFVVRNLFVALLVTVSILSWGHTISVWNRNKAEIVIQLADFLEKVALPYKIAKLASLPPDEQLIIPIRNVGISDIEDTFGDPRPDRRTHEGIDIFADRGTPVHSVVSGYVTKLGNDKLGGNFIITIGAGGRRYYYAHLDRFAQDIKVGSYVTPDTVLGYVGNTGNATSTPYHLHLGMYAPKAQNPYHIFVEHTED